MFHDSRPSHAPSIVRASVSSDTMGMIFLTPVGKQNINAAKRCRVEAKNEDMIEDLRLVTGNGSYADDVSLSGQHPPTVMAELVRLSRSQAIASAIGICGTSPCMSSRGFVNRSDNAYGDGP
jgi:hypothetical protein